MPTVARDGKFWVVISTYTGQPAINRRFKQRKAALQAASRITQDGYFN